jgi:hypothetical protein
MKKFVLFLAIVILAGCSPTRRLARLLERYPIPEKIDTLYTPGKTIYRDTTVYKYLPGEVSVESLYIDIPISIPDTFIEAHTSTADAIAYLQDNVLGLQIIQYDTVIKWKIDSALVYHRDTVVITKDIPYPVIEKAKPFYKNGFFILAGLILVSLVLFFVFRRK